MKGRHQIKHKERLEKQDPGKKNLRCKMRRGPKSLKQTNREESITVTTFDSSDECRLMSEI